MYSYCSDVCNVLSNSTVNNVTVLYIIIKKKNMFQGVVHTSLRLQSRIYNNSLGERLLFRAWNFPPSKQASSQQRYKLLRGATPLNKDAFGCESEVIWFNESESKYTPVPGRRYAPVKILGGGG